MSDLSEAMLAAGIHAWENCPFDDERDFRAFLAAALRVLAPRQVPGWDGADLIELADRIEHPAEEAH